MKTFFGDCIGKTVTDPRFADDDEYGESLDYRPYDEDAEGEEANWSVSISLLFTVEDGKLVSIEPYADITCPGDSGLGDVDPYDYWEPSDYEKAESFLRRITQ